MWIPFVENLPQTINIYIYVHKVLCHSILTQVVFAYSALYWKQFPLKNYLLQALFLKMSITVTKNYGSEKLLKSRCILKTSVHYSNSTTLQKSDYLMCAASTKRLGTAAVGNYLCEQIKCARIKNEISGNDL
jgi:hypothetical protein